MIIKLSNASINNVRVARPVLGTMYDAVNLVTHDSLLAPRRNQRRLGVVDQEALDRLHRRHLLS